MWLVRLNDEQLEVLRALVRSQGELGPALRGALEAIDFARWDELPEAHLPWDRLEEAAREQGVSEADVFWDVCGRHPDPPAPPVPRRVH